MDVFVEFVLLVRLWNMLKNGTRTQLEIFY